MMLRVMKCRSAILRLCTVAQPFPARVLRSPRNRAGRKETTSYAEFFGELADPCCSPEVKSPFHILFCAVTAIVFSACDKSDLGTPCPPKVAATASSQPTDASEVDSPATFRKDSTCESFLCVSSQTRANYCSQECFSNANCPSGFVCETPQPVGDYKDTKFCLLAKVCNSDADCPKSGFFCNKTIPTSVPGTFA